MSRRSCSRRDDLDDVDFSSTIVVPIKTNLIRQNCFLVDKVVSQSTSSAIPDQFESLDEVVVDNGVELRRVVQDYPITPEYVSSFADSADYRNDMSSSLSSKPTRPNLGDVRDIQSVSNMDMTEARALYKQLVSKFGSSIKSASSEDSSKNEVNENV